MVNWEQCITTQGIITSLLPLIFLLLWLFFIHKNTKYKYGENYNAWIVSTYNSSKTKQNHHRDSLDF